MVNSSDKALLLSADEQRSFRILYDKYWQELYRKAIARLQNEDDAEDVVQEVFVSLWRNRHSISVEDSLAPYLFSALKYATLKLLYRKAKKGLILPKSLQNIEVESSTVENYIDCKELTQNIEHEVQNLPGRMREIYQLSRVEQLRNAEIAARLNISEQTVKNTLTVTLKRLKSRILNFFL